MGAKITKNSFDPKKAIRAKMELYTKRGKQAALLLVTEMVRDTNAGQDIQGKAFKPYSQGYREWREEQRYQLDPPNLTITGQMLNAMTADLKLVSDTRAEGQINFRNLNTLYTRKTKEGSSTYSVSTVDKAKWNNKTRRFFGLTPKKRQFFLNYIQKG